MLSFPSTIEPIETKFSGDEAIPAPAKQREAFFLRLALPR